MGAPLWYNFQQSPHVHHICQYILGISHRWLKKWVNFLLEGEDSTNLLTKNGEQVETLKTKYSKGIPTRMLAFWKILYIINGILPFV